MNLPPSIVPEQNLGIQTNTESSVDFSNEVEARNFFQQVTVRLLHVNQWHDLAGSASANFQLTDSRGNEVDRPAQKGDHFKIDIPGPGSITGEGNDWVRIESIEETEDNDRQVVAIRVRPATNPRNDREDVAHFFNSEATSSFVISREKNKVAAGVYGRNEKPNLETEKVADKIRNAAVAAGAISGFSKLQWKSLINGLLGS